MGVIEGFTTVMIDGSTTEEQKSNKLCFCFFALMIKFLLILVVW